MAKHQVIIDTVFTTDGAHAFFEYLDSQARSILQGSGKPGEKGAALGELTGTARAHVASEQQAGRLDIARAQALNLEISKLTSSFARLTAELATGSASGPKGERAISQFQAGVARGELTGLRDYGDAARERDVGNAKAQPPTRAGQVKATDDASEEANRQRAIALGVTKEELKIRDALAERFEKEKALLDVVGSPLDIDARRQSIELRQKQRDAQQKALNAFYLEHPEAKGTFTQRVLAGLHTGGSGAGVPRLGIEEQTLGQFLKGKLATTAGFALTGGGVYGAVEGFKKLVEYATEFQRALVVLKNSEAAFAEQGQGGFEHFREEILKISRDTGVSGEEVAGVAFQMKGAFHDTEEAVQNTRAAVEAAAVSGLDLTEVVDSLTAAAKSLNGSGPTKLKVDVRDISDLALGLQERFGVLSKESIKFFGDIAPTAAEAGLSLKELGAIAGTAQQYSGRAGGALAEQFNRILPTIGEVGIELAAVFQGNAKLSGLAGQIAEDTGSGQTGRVLVTLIRHWNDLTVAQQQNAINLLGGRREAQALIPVLEHSAQAVAEMDRKTSDAGKTQKYFADLQNTVALAMARLRQTFEQIGEAIFRAGVAEALQDIAGAAFAVLDVIRLVAEMFANLNEATGGFIGHAAFLVAGLVAIRRGMVALAGIKGLGFLGALGPEGALATRYAGAIAARSTAEAAATPLGASAFGASVSGALGGTIAGVGFGTGVLAAGIGVAAFYARARVKAKKASDDFQAKLQAADLDQLQDIMKIRYSFLDHLAFNLTGRTDPATQAGNRFRALTTQQLVSRSQALGATGITSADLQKDFTKLLATNKGVHSSDDVVAVSSAVAGGPNSKAFQSIRDKAAKGNKFAEDFLNIVEQDVSSNADTYKKYQDEIKRINGESNVKDAKDFITGSDKAASAAVQQRQAILQAFEAGDLSRSDAIRQLGRLANLYKIAANGHELAPKLQAEMTQLFHDVSKLADDRIKNALEFTLELSKAQGGTPQQRLLLTRQALNQTKNPQNRAALARQLLQDDQALLDYSIKNASSFDEAAQIIQHGVSLGIEERLALTAQKISELSGPWEDALSSEGAKALHRKDLTRTIVERANRLNISLNESLAQLVEIQRAHLRDLIKGIHLHGEKVPENILADLRNVEALAASLGTLPQENIVDGKIVGDPNEQARNNAANYRRAQTARLTAKYGGVRDPLRLAQKAIDAANVDKQTAARLPGVDQEEAKLQAQAAMAEAINDRDDALNDIARAHIELAQAQTTDPVEAARRGKELADLALRTAVGEAARLRAQAEQVKADRTIEEAIFDVTRANFELLQAYADVGGRTVESAQLAGQLAVAELNELLKTKPDDKAAILRAQANVARTQGAVRDADLAQKEEDIQFALDMEQVTTSQAIAQLEALLQIPNLTQEQTRDILRKIKQLKDELSQDLQFNLPSDLKLPTLYEARRLNQSAGGYQDNRQVAVTMYINNGMDQKAAEQMLNNALGSNRYGFASRRY